MPKTLLRRERERRGWSRSYIAEQVEVDVITVGRWERGERLPHPHYRQQLCTLFTMTAEELGLLPEMFQKSDETTGDPTTPEQAVMLDVTSTPESMAVPNATPNESKIIDQSVVAESAPDQLIAPAPSQARTMQRRKLLLGLGGLGVAGLAGFGILYARSFSSTSAHMSQAAALILPNQPAARLFDPTNFTNWVNRLAWSPNGSRIAGANGVNNVSIWSIAPEVIQFSYPTLNQWVNDVSWSKTNWIAAANAAKNASIQGTGSIQIWQYPALKPTWTQLFPYALRTVSWSPGGTLLALAGHAQTVEIWNPFHATRLSQYKYAELNAQEGISRVKWSPDGTLLACAADDGTVHILNTPGAQARYIYRGHKLRVVDLAWSPDGKYIASGGEDHTVRVWHALSGQTLFVYRGHTNKVEAIDWSPQNRYIASGGADSLVQIWEAQTGNQRTRYELPGDTVETLLWSPDGKKLAAGTDKQGIYVW